MNYADIIIGAVVFIIVALAARSVYKDKKNGGCCSSKSNPSCSGCPNSKSCNQK